jgi:hypothetical protein
MVAAGSRPFWIVRRRVRRGSMIRARSYLRSAAFAQPLASRVVALVTRDPALYAELAGGLRERAIPTLSLLPGDRIPDRVVAVLTSPEEAPAISHSRVLAVPGGSVDRAALWAAVRSAIGAVDPSSELVVGIDPGPRPGYAVLAREACLDEGTLDGPEEVAGLGRHLRRRFPSRGVRFRVGSGDPNHRTRILNALLPLHRPVELVNERNTTPHGSRRATDAAAARLIARTPGKPVRAPVAMRITEGEVANVQRLSRETSGGRFTIPRALAFRVLEGRITLGEAVEEGRRRYRLGSAPTAAGPRAGAAREPS